MAVADLSAAETKKITAKDLVQSGYGLTDPASLNPAKLNWAIIAPGAIGGLAISDRTLPAGKLVLDSITAQEIAPNAIGASELADGAVDTAALQPKAVTAAQIADDTITAAQIAPSAVGTNELLDLGVTTAKLADKSVTTSKIADLAVTAAQITKGTITSAEIAADTITAAQIAPNAITASELADGAVDTSAVANGAVTNDKIAVGIDGAKLTDNTVTAAKIPASSLNRGIDKTGGAIGHTNAIAGSVRSGISYDAHGHITAAVPLVPSDLPVATDAAIGGVSVPAASGLIVSGVGALGHANSVVAGTVSGVSYDAQGHVTGIAPLAPSDLPLATDTKVGVVRIQGPALRVDATGLLSHNNSGIAAGTYPKVVVDVRGHVTAGLLLVATDIPNLDASQINTGTFDAARLADRSITQEKLNDYAISFIQEAEPTSVNLYHNGMLWYKESTAQLHMWNGNSWMTVGSLGRLGAQNMRFCGTFNAATGDIIDLTEFGTSSGFAVGAIPAADDKNTGAYFVCKVAGTYAGAAYDAGDWVLSLGQTKGWTRIDTLNGGSSSAAIKDLIDVTITSPNSGETLIFDGTLNKWVNRPTAAKKATFTQALDGNRTTFTLSADGSAATGLLISLGGVIQEADKDFTFVAPRTVNFSAPPPANSPYWVLIEGVPATGGGGGTTLPNGTAAEEYLKWNTTLGVWVAASVLEGGTY